MREIKFRAWDADTSRMMGWEEVRHSPNLITLNLPGVMQYTGLKDKNGAEIYEGDIVLVAGFSRPFKIDYGYHSNTICGYYIPNDNSCLILGNVYENPELLK